MPRPDHVPVPPFYIQPMTFNATGQGPETDPTKIVKTSYEIWDACLLCLSSHATPEEAQRALEELRQQYR